MRGRRRRGKRTGSSLVTTRHLDPATSRRTGHGRCRERRRRRPRPQWCRSRRGGRSADRRSTCSPPSRRQVVTPLIALLVQSMGVPDGRMPRYEHRLDSALGSAAHRRAIVCASGRARCSLSSSSLLTGSLMLRPRFLYSTRLLADARSGCPTLPPRSCCGETLYKSDQSRMPSHTVADWSIGSRRSPSLGGLVPSGASNTSSTGFSTKVRLPRAIAHENRATGYQTTICIVS